ncbi:hypothetical protein HI914_04946 [Erysiphe necator]|nr:hypothetical protein HI914_04946 [Erysiphe necator]
MVDDLLYKMIKFDLPVMFTLINALTARKSYTSKFSPDNSDFISLTKETLRRHFQAVYAN